MSVHDAKDERRETQKRTFTRWINVYLSRHDPQTEVCDLFRDIQDGKILMALLEELTGCKLLYRFRPSPHRIFRLNNISKALAFLDDRHVKLLGIDASAVADGVPAVVLSLIWNIILHFQVKVMTGGLHRQLSSSLSSLSMVSEVTEDSISNPGQNTVKGPKYNGKTIKILLHWAQRCTVKFGVEVQDFGRSWRNGLAFLALIKFINPDLVDLRLSLTKDPEENLEEAFRTAQQQLDIPPLLEPQDVTCSSPDEKSIITYVSMFLRHCPDIVEDLSTAVNSPHIYKYRSLETLVDRQEAQSVFSSLETSHELLLWKHWARRSSNSTSQSKRKSSSALQPPSPLDAFVANPDIHSWLAKSSDYGYSTKNNEVHFPLTSEEGIYSLTPLDSDEEDAYSYILDLNKDVLQSQAKRKVQSVEEATEENSLISDEEQAQIHILNKDLNGHSKEKSTNIEQGRRKKRQSAKADSLTRQREERLSKTTKGESLKSETFTEFSPQRAMDLEGNSKEVSEHTEKEKRTQRNTQFEAGYSKKEPLDNLHNNDIEKEKQLQAPKTVMEQIKNMGKSTTSRDSFIENLTQNTNVAKNENDLKKLRRRKEEECEAGQRIESKGVSGDVSATSDQNNIIDTSLHSYKTHREESVRNYHGPSSITARERGVLVESVAPSSGVNQTDLHIVLFLWMLLYCFFIGHQIIS